MCRPQFGATLVQPTPFAYQFNEDDITEAEVDGEAVDSSDMYALKRNSRVGSSWSFDLIRELPTASKAKALPLVSEPAVVAQQLPVEAVSEPTAETSMPEEEHPNVVVLPSFVTPVALSSRVEPEIEVAAPTPLHSLPEAEPEREQPSTQQPQMRARHDDQPRQYNKLPSDTRRLADNRVTPTHQFSTYTPTRSLTSKSVFCGPASPPPLASSRATTLVYTLLYTLLALFALTDLALPTLAQSHTFNSPLAIASTPTGRNVTQTFTIAYLETETKTMLAVNGMVPGPQIECTAGDMVEILVINNLNESVTIHFHGQIQRGTPDMDGVPGITQCGIAPGTSMTYRFQADPPGTYWWHSHDMGQYTDGLYGPLIVHDPLGDPYVDQYQSTWTWMTSDYYNMRAMDLLGWYLSTDNADGIEPTPDAIAVNGQFDGKLVYNATNTDTVLVRYINAATFSMYNISIDGLPLIVTQLDGTDVEPYAVPWFILNVAQRANFLVNFTSLQNTSIAGATSVYFRVQAVVSMYDMGAGVSSYQPPYEKQANPYNPSYFNPLFRGIIQLRNPGVEQNLTAPVVLPTYSLPPLYPEPSVLNHTLNYYTNNDTNLLNARPMIPTSISPAIYQVPEPTYKLTLTTLFATNADGINVAMFNGVSWPGTGKSFDAIPPAIFDYTKGTQLSMSSYDYTQQTDSAGHFVVPSGAVVELYLENNDGGEHPFHLHGHNFWIIATSANPQAEAAYTNQYLIRDTVSVPAAVVNDDTGDVYIPGWAKIRFIADNPGAWIFHCHIQWHMDAGLVALMVEAPEVMRSMTLSSADNGVCGTAQQFNTLLAQQAAEDAGITTYQIDAATIGYAFISNAIIVSESLVAYFIYRLGVLPYILLEVLAFMIGTLLGAVVIELIPDTYEQVFVDYSLGFELTAFLFLLGILFSYSVEKFLKRGRGNKFQQLVAMYTAKGQFSAINNNTLMRGADLRKAQQQRLLGGDAKEAGTTAQLDRTDSDSSNINTDYQLHESSSNRSGSNLIPTNAAPSEISDANRSASEMPLMMGGGPSLYRTSSEVSTTSTATDQHAGAPPHSPEPAERPRDASMYTVGEHPDEHEPAYDEPQNQKGTYADDIPVAVAVDEHDQRTQATDEDEMPAYDDISAANAAKRRLGGNSELATLEKLHIMESERKLALGTDWTIVIIMLVGDMMHNFCDGATIAAAWVANDGSGLATTIGIFMEELPHLIGMFAVFVAAGASVKRAIFLNVLGASPFLIGGGIIIGIASIPGADIAKLGYLIIFAVGTFLYIIMVDLLPVLTANWQGYRRAIIQIIVACVGVGIQAGVNVYNHKQGV